MKNRIIKLDVDSLALNIEKINHLKMKDHEANRREYTDDTGCPTCPGVNSCLVC
ncbi:MAG: hypothetical protein ACEPOV_05030 [Hyphomicrobiales bacterium]